MSFNAGSIKADLTLGRSQWLKDLRTTKKEIADLERRSITIGIDADSTNAQIVLDNIEMMANDLDGNDYSFSIDASAAEANATLDLLEQKIDRMDGREVGITADADVINAMIQLDILENQMDVLENDPINIEADADLADVAAQIAALGEQVDHLDGRQIDISADLDAADDMARMAALGAQVSALDGRTIDIDTDFDRDTLESLVGSASGGAGGGGGYLGLLKILLYGIVILSPVLAVSISSLTAALIGFLSAMTAAAGAAIILGGGLFGLVKLFKDTDPSDYTPAMQNFADAIEAVGDAWDNALQQIQGPGFGLMAQGLEIVADIIPDLVPLFNAVADAMSGVLDGLASWIDSPQYQEMLDFFGGFGVDMLVQFLEIGGNLLVFFGELFAAIEPFAREMMQGIEDLTQSWADWAAELDENRAFQDFMENASTYGPMVLDMLGSLLDAFMNLGDALMPFAGPMLEGLTFFFDLIANIDPSTLTNMIGIFAGMWAGAHILLPILTGIGGAITAITTAAGIGLAPLALIAGAIGLVVAAVVDLWRENGAFKDSVMNIWNSIRDTVVPIVEDIWAKIQENWGPISEWASGIFESVKSIVTDAMAIIEFVVVGILDEIKFAWQNWGDEIMAVVEWFFGIVGPIISGGFTVIEGLFQTISSVLQGDWQGAWDGIKKILDGALQILLNAVRLFSDPVSNAWSAIKDVVTGWWEKMTTALQNKWIAFRGWVEEKWANFKSWVAGWGVNAMNIWEDIKGRWTAMRGNIEEKWASFKAWVSGWAPNLPSIWDDIVAKWTAMKGDIETKWTNFKADIAGWVVNGAGIFDSIKEAFRGVLNTIVGWWNGFSLSVNIPDKIPGLPDSFTINTPDVGGYAKGAYVPGNKPHLAWFGEGADNEVVAPEPVLRRIVEEHSGGAFDAQAFAAALHAALQPLLSRLNISIAQLAHIVEEAGIGTTIDARSYGDDGSRAVQQFAADVMFQMRVLGFGGKAAATT